MPAMGAPTTDTHIMPAAPRHVTYQHRGYVRATGHTRLRDVLAMLATLHNAALQNRRDAYEMAGQAITYYDQCKELTHIRADDPAWAALQVGVGRGALQRVGRAFKAFFGRVKGGGKPGYPRFRSRRRYTCIEIACPTPSMVRHYGDGKVAVVVKGLPSIRLRRTSRALPDPCQLKTLRIHLKPTGVQVDLGYAEEREALAPSNEATGIDAGVVHRLALSDGSFIPSRDRMVERRQDRRLRRRLARARRGSNGRRKAARALSRHTYRERIRNRNECHRITTDLVRRFGYIAIEDLHIKNMTRSAAGTVEEPGRNVKAKRGLNRTILDQTPGLLRGQLTYKAEWAGRQLAVVDSAYTSQTCAACGHVDASSRVSQAVFLCTGCGHADNADTNAARNVLARALRTGPGLRPGSAKQPVGVALAGTVACGDTGI